MFGFVAKCPKILLLTVTILLIGVRSILQWREFTGGEFRNFQKGPIQGVGD